MPITKEQLRIIIKEQFEGFRATDLGVRREQLAQAQRHFSSPQVLLITGLRRCGKSTLAAQIANLLGENGYYYANFEDDRLANFQVSDFQKLLEVFIELFGEKKVFIFDEVQIVAQWERFVRRMSDQGNKFFITGSNATLLSHELGTKLTGRNTTIELFPFSFKEYLDFKGFTPPQVLDTASKVKLDQYLMTYLREGGIALALRYPELNILSELYRDVLSRDVVIRYRLDSDKAVRDLASYLFNNPATLQSYSKLKQLIQLKNVTTIKNYCHYFELGWLTFTIPLYAASIKRQQLAPKKICLIDNGIVTQVAVETGSKLGRMFENLVFLHLRRKFSEIFYYLSAGGEVDLCVEKERVFYQVCMDLSDPLTRQRELKALVAALRENPRWRGVVVTLEQDENLELDGQEIRIIPAYKFLLGLS